MIDTSNGENLPGYKKKSFEIPYCGGNIWIEHLDGIYEYEELVLCKLESDINLFTKPSSTSYICFVFHETIITDCIIDMVRWAILESGKRFTKIAFVGTDRKSKRKLGRIFKNKGLCFNFADGLEDAKQWFVAK